MRTLILYGAYNLNNYSKIKSHQAPGEQDTKNLIQKIQNATAPGSTVVGSKIDEKKVVLSSTIQATDSKSLTEIRRELDYALQDKNRYLRFSRNWKEIAGVSNSTDWRLEGDAVSKSYDTEEYQYLKGSLKFNLDVSQSVDNEARVIAGDVTPVNLSEYQGQGNFEAWVYIPDPTYITGIKILIGSDSSNYLTSPLLAQQYDGEELVQGWNFVTVAWEDMIATGIIDPYAITIGGVYFDYTADQADLTGLRVGGIIWQDEANTINYRAYPEEIGKDVQAFNNDFTKARLGFLINTGLGQSTNESKVYEISGITSVTKQIVISLEGTYTPQPIFVLTLTTATNLAKIIIENDTTGDVVEIPATYANGDVIKIDFENSAVTQNNTPIGYNDVLPRFRVGRNVINITLVATGEQTLSETTNNANLGGQ